MRKILFVLGVGLFAPTAVAAQSGGDAGVGAACTNIPVTFAADTRDFCFTVAQAVESLQPQVGIVIAGGNVTPGSATHGGLHLTSLPGLTITGKVNIVSAHFPDVSDANSGVGRVTGEKSLPAPVVQGTAALGIFRGLNPSPGASGLGSIDLLGSVSWLPIKASQLHGFGENTATTAFGFGGRLGLIKESFVTPGVSVTVMYHSLGQVSYGSVCAQDAPTAGLAGDEYELESGSCPTTGDPGELAFDLKDVSTRAQIAKHVGLFGFAAGVGYDSWKSEIDYGFRGNCTGVPNCFVRVTNADLDSDRFSAFGNASVGGILGSLVGEVGWLQGDDPIAGYNSAASEFDPKKGTIFGSVGLKLTF
jgi:hypothetical protein